MRLFTTPARVRRWSGARALDVVTVDGFEVARLARSEYRHMRRNCGLRPYDARRCVFGYLVAIGCDVALVKALAS